MAGLWYQPCPIVAGVEPVTSDGFAQEKWIDSDGDLRRQHIGLDITLKGKINHGIDYPFAEYWFYMPDNIPFICPHDGVIWSAKHQKNGWAIRIDHGHPEGLPAGLEGVGLNSLNLHMTSMAKEWKKGDRCIGGEPLGIIGAAGGINSKTDMRHVHQTMMKFTTGGPTSYAEAGFDHQPWMDKNWVFRKVDGGGEFVDGGFQRPGQSGSGGGGSAGGDNDGSGVVIAGLVGLGLVLV